VKSEFNSETVDFWPKTRALKPPTVEFSLKLLNSLGRAGSSLIWKPRVMTLGSGCSCWKRKNKKAKSHKVILTFGRVFGDLHGKLTFHARMAVWRVAGI
jgi:hypothetical protein